MPQEKRIAIIGAAGKMGLWFTNYFLKKCKDASISVYDIDREPLLNLDGARVEIADGVGDCVKAAGIVVICVPVQKTQDIIKKCVSQMKDGALLVEISSVKSKTFGALSRVPARVHPLCIHPMFGPGADVDGTLKILLVPVRDRDREVAALGELFGKLQQPSRLAIRVLGSAREHDRSIALVLGLTYFANIAFAKVLAKEDDISTLRDVSGTTFGLQLMLSESILTDEPELISALIAENPQVSKYVKSYVNEARKLERLLGAGKGRTRLKESVKATKEAMMEKEDIEQAYRNMYKLIGSIK